MSFLVSIIIVIQVFFILNNLNAQCCYIEKKKVINDLSKTFVIKSDFEKCFDNLPKMGNLDDLIIENGDMPITISDSLLKYEIYMGKICRDTIFKKVNWLINLTYQWQDNSVTKTYTINGNTLGIGKKTYWVKVSGSNGCFGTDSITISVTWNSKLESLLKQGWNIYPNPTKDVLQIYSKDHSSYKWFVYNLNGQQILAGNETDAINLSSLPQGVYFVRIQSKGVVEMIKVSKLD